MSYTPIVPAVIPNSEAALKAYASQLLFSPEFHLDIVDGKFVPTTSWPYEPEGEPKSVKSYLDCYTLEVDLMVAQPLEAAAAWLEAGADMLVFHVETLTQAAFVHFAQSARVSIGVSAHGDTSMETLLTYAASADYIQLMGIHEIGAQGFPLDEKVFGKIARLKKELPQMSITIDGSVNADTIVRLKDAGADRFICGSAIVKQPDPAAAHQALSALVNQ